MAAPIGVYRDKSFFMNKSGVNYEHLTAILQESDSVMKQRFYLDELFIVRLEDGTDGVIGMVGEGSANEAMHNLTTRGGVGRAYKGGRAVRMLNDGGLNTKGTAFSFTLISDKVNDVRYSYSFQAAYYVKTDRTGAYYSINGGGQNSSQRVASLAQNTARVDTFTANQIGLKAGDIISLKPFNENIEGIYTPSSYTDTISVKPALYSTKYSNEYASYAYLYGTVGSLYVGTANIGVGTYVYADESMLSMPSAGYYAIGETWIEVRQTTVNSQPVMWIVATGDCTPNGWPDGDPNKDTGGYDTILTFRDATGFVNPCERFNDGLLPNYTIYLRHFDNRYYTDTSWGSYANGYFVWGAPNWRRMVNGSIVETGACPVT